MKGDDMKAASKEIDGKEIEDFVRSTCLGISKGLTEGLVVQSVELEIAIVNQWKTGCGIKLYVVGASAKYKKEEISKIKIQIGPRGLAALGRQR
jgi:hypothetical protein